MCVVALLAASNCFVPAQPLTWTVIAGATALSLSPISKMEVWTLLIVKEYDTSEEPVFVWTTVLH